jgi:protein-S-isoprenylcysteine O-methyltransferase Ste14
MAWLPPFKLGLWNVWILMLVLVLHPLILVIADKAIGTGEIFKKMGDAPTGKREKRENAIATAILYLLVAYSIFLPLKVGTAWLYAGLATWLVGLGFFLAAIVNVATTPTGQIFKKGLYRISRHPLYFSVEVILLGAGVASASWIFLLLTFVHMLLLNAQAGAEERACLKTFGDAYKEYMHRTPKWLGIPGSR